REQCPYFRHFANPRTSAGIVEMVPPVGLTSTREIEMMRNVLLVLTLTGSGLLLSAGDASAQRRGGGRGGWSSGYDGSGYYGYSPYYGYNNYGYGYGGYYSPYYYGSGYSPGYYSGQTYYYTTPGYAT